MVGPFLVLSLLLSSAFQHALAGTSLPETRVKRAVGAACVRVLLYLLASVNFLTGDSVRPFKQSLVARFSFLAILNT